MYELITFDCYGTLIDWESGIRRALVTEAARRGVDAHGDALVREYIAVEAEVEAETYRSYRDVLAETTSRIAKRLHWPDGSAHFLAGSVQDWLPFDDTNPALEVLVQHDVALGILSNIDRDLIAATLRHFTVPFEFVITAEDVRAYKPAHTHFLAAREHTRGRRWLHAAQSRFHDIAPCIELGIDAVWIDRNNERSGGPVARVRDLAGLVDLLGAAEA